MTCPHLLLVWAEKSEYPGESELMLCAACGERMKFDKHYKRIELLS